MSVQLYRYTTWTLTIRIEKKLDRNHKFDQIQEASPLKIAALRPLTSHLTDYPCKTCWVKWCKDELISDVLLLTPTHKHSSVGWLEKTFVYQLNSNSEYCLQRSSIGTDGERESGDSVQWAWLDDYNDYYFINYSSTPTHSTMHNLWYI